MPADPKVYDSARLAHAYAWHRPAVHPLVLAHVRDAMGDALPVAQALDAGCGAGASTAALLPLARQVTGLDPFLPMLQAAGLCVPQARFLQGRLEAIPCPDASFDLVASAGAINYTEPRLALAELARVLKLGGWLALYDFSDGRPQGEAGRTNDPVAAMRKAYPPSGGYALDLTGLPFADHGLSLSSALKLAFDLLMSPQQYLDYMMGDTGVEAAIAAGTPEPTVRAHMTGLVELALAGREANVRFGAELVVARRVARRVVPAA
jgi:SAM-dependent methyltransferase